MNCPKCNSSTISKIEGSTLIIKCTECEWSVATSYVDPIYEDETVYIVRVGQVLNPNKEQLKAVSSVAGVNFIAAKKTLETPGATLIEGLAPEIKESVAKLSESNVAITIEPEYPYL